jgi:hypothetical protein
VSDPSCGSDIGPGAQPVPQTGRPPVPRRVPSDPPPPADQPDSWHRTEQVPFPLPPLPSIGAAPVPGPETGQLDLGGYPPRVPAAEPGPDAGENADRRRDAIRDDR